MAVKNGLSQILLEVRETQDRAISLYENAGYLRWGMLPAYHIVNGEVTSGLFYQKRIDKNK